MEGTIGEMKVFAGNFAPQNWMECNGALLSISQYQTLFSIIRTTYGGNGSSTFALPNLNGRTLIGRGKTPGQDTDWNLGQTTGAEAQTISLNQMPSHNHSSTLNLGKVDSTSSISGSVDARMVVNGGNADTEGATGRYLAGADGVSIYSDSKTLGTTLATDAIYTTNNLTVSVDVSIPSPSMNIGYAGGSQPLNIMQPSLVGMWIICFNGIYPTRS